MNQQLQEAARLSLNRYEQTKQDLRDYLIGPMRGGQATEAHRHYVAGFLAGAAYMQEEAVRFTEWVAKNEWQPEEGRWYMDCSDDIVVWKTTSELYAIYKQSLI